MMTVYVVCALAGGVLILLSLLGHEHGLDAHGDADFSPDLNHGAADLGWIPFLSIRFWTYLLTGFGLTGMVLTMLGTVNRGLIPWLAGATGLVCGLGVALTLRALSRQNVSTSATPQELMGVEALVTVAIRPGAPGRIRCSLKGEVIDFLAVSEEPDPLEAGSSVIIVDFQNDRAKVISRSALYNPDSVTVHSP